jgi:pantoate--beta-alanine ligase
MQAAATALRRQTKTIGFVPTMGALHEGHLALIREARQRADIVVVSVFVNPLQFNEAADLKKYPRTIESDLAKCHTERVDVVFAPLPQLIYPAGFQTTVVPGELARRWEGAGRKGHFEGVTTVCTKLFQLVRPHFTVFGEKDFQQLAIIRRLVRDLHLPLEVLALPVIREPDGLALSSRNVRLSKTARKNATCLYRALVAAQDKVQAGETRARSVQNAARKVLKDTPGFTPAYCAVVDPETLEPIESIERPARLLLAGSFGSGKREIRLLDNGPLFPPL